MTADGSTGGNFNRYWYANNNPYKFTDPDGRQSASWAGAWGDVQPDGNASAQQIAEAKSDGAVAGLVMAAKAFMRLNFGGDAPGAAPASAPVAIAKTATALERASEISGAMSKVTQSKVTIAVAETAEGTRVVGSSEGALRSASKAALQSGEVAVRGAKGVHAEVNAVNGAKNLGLTPTSVAPSRAACGGCQAAMKEAGVAIEGPLKRK